MDFVVEPSTSEPVPEPVQDLTRRFTSVGNKPTPTEHIGLDSEFDSSSTPEALIVRISTVTVLSATLTSGKELLLVQKSDTNVESMCKNPIPGGESKNESADGLSSGFDGASRGYPSNGRSSDSSCCSWNVFWLVFLCLCLLAFVFALVNYNGLNDSSRHGFVSTDLLMCPSHQFQHDLPPQDRTDNSSDSTCDVATTPHKIPPLAKPLKQFPHLDLPVYALTSERTEMATCFPTDSPTFHLCPTQPSTHTKSRHADTQIHVHKEFARGSHLEMKSVIPTTQYVQRNKSCYAHFDESLIWHTQYYEAYPEMEIQYANASHILTIFFMVLHRTSLRNKPKCHTIAATSQRNKHQISTDLPSSDFEFNSSSTPEAPMTHVSTITVLSATLRPGEELFLVQKSDTYVESMCKNAIPDPTGGESKNESSDGLSSGFHSQDDTLHILTIFFMVLHGTRNKPKCYTVAAASQRNKHQISAFLPPDKPPQNNCFRSAETGYEPDSRSLFCHATNSTMPYPTTEHHSNRLRWDTSKDNFNPREDAMCESRDDMDTVCCTAPALELVHFSPNKSLSYDSTECPPADFSGTLGTEVHHFTIIHSKPDTDPVRGCVTPVITSEKFLIEETSAPLPNVAHDDVIQEGIGDDANSQGVLLTIFGSPLSKVRSLWFLLLQVVLLLLLTTRNSNHSLAIYSRHDLVLSTVSDLSYLPVCPTHQPKYSVSFLIRLHVKHNNKWPDSTEIPDSPLLTRCLQQFPSLDLPACALNSESTEMATCLLIESPKVPLCSTPTSVPTKSGHAGIQTNIQNEIKEFAWGNYSEKAIIPTARSVQCSKPYIHSDDILIWHTQYQVNPEIQYAKALRLLTVFLTVLHMSSLRIKPKCRTIVATSQQDSLSLCTKVRLISADLPPEKPPQSSGFSSVESGVEPDSRPLVCDRSLLHQTTKHQSHSSTLTCNTSKDNFNPKEDAAFENCDTQGDLHVDTAEEQASKSAFYHSADDLPHPTTEHQSNKFSSNTSIPESRDDIDTVCCPADCSGTLGTEVHYFTITHSKPDADPVRGPVATSETFLIEETSSPLPNVAHDDDIQERIGYYSKYHSETDELTEQSSFPMRKQGNSESGFGSTSSSSLLDPSEERLPLTDPIPKTPDHTLEQTDGGGGGSGSGSGTSCGGGSGGSRSEGGTGDGGIGGGSEGGGSGPGAGGSGGDDRDNPDRKRREGSLDIPPDCESKKSTTPDKQKKKKHCPPEYSDSGYKTKPLSTSNSVPTIDHIKQGLTPRTNVSSYPTGASMLVYPHPHLLPRLELAEDMQQPQLEPVGEPPAVTSGLESHPPNGASSVFEVPNKEHHYSPVSTEGDETQAQISPPRQWHNPPPPFSNSYPSQEDVPVAPRAASPEHSTREEPQISTEESGKQSGTSVIVYFPLQRPLDCAGNHPMSSGGCKLETQEHKRPSYWKLIDGASLVLETPGDNYFPSKIPDDDDPSQGQDRPPRRHHNPPPPFLSFSPHEEVPVAPSPVIATNGQVEPGAADDENSDCSDNGDWVEDWFENDDKPDNKDWSESSSSDAEELGEGDSGVGDSN